jgi:cyclohexa-1,5-dienecarbonyl-CoA hydratase
MGGPTDVETVADADAQRFEHLRIERRGSVARLVLDRPPLNVLNIAMLEELDAALAGLAAEPDLKVLVLAGAGRAFCAGADVGDHLPDRVAPMLHLFHRVVKRLLGFECPTIAAVHGAALGGGCELAIACDLIIARDDATLGQPEIKLGVFPPVAAALLPRRVGMQRALDLVLSGRSVDAGEAKAMGLVSTVVYADDFAGVCDSYAGRLAALSGPVLRLTKRVVLESAARPERTAIDHAETVYLDELMRLQDAREGLAAFLEKRSPNWKEA